MKSEETTEQGQVSAPGESSKDEERQGKTGSHLLDNLFETALDESLVAAYVCLRLSRVSDLLGDRIEVLLESRIKPYREGKFPDARSKVGDYLRVCNWLAFLNSVEKTIGGSIDNADEPAKVDRDKIVDETVNILSGKEAVEETGTTGKESCFAKEQFDMILDNVRKELVSYNPFAQKEVLEAALEEVHKITDRASRLIAMRNRVCAIYDGLDAKAKCAITVMQELAAVEGCSVGVDYGNELLYTTGRDKGIVEQAQAELPDDSDVKVLAEVFELSSFINQAV